MLLFGAFTFAFTLGEAIHELGHYVADRAYGAEARIRLDPFGGSRILLDSPLPKEGIGIACAAGPLPNIIIGVTLFLLLWQKRSPALLPLLLWGPSALIQEGVTFSLGLLTPGGDGQWIIQSGVPGWTVLGAGLVFLALGVVGVCALLPLLGLSPGDSFPRKLGIVAGGMSALMFVRGIGSLLMARGPVVESVVPLVFSLLLAMLVTAVHRPLSLLSNRFMGTEQAVPRRSAVASALVMGAGVIVFQLLLFN